MDKKVLFYHNSVQQVAVLFVNESMEIAP